MRAFIQTAVLFSFLGICAAASAQVMFYEPGSSHCARYKKSNADMLIEDRVRALDFVARDKGIVPPPNNVRRTRDWKDIVQRLHRASLVRLDT